MEFYEPVVYENKSIRLNGMRTFDPDKIYEDKETSSGSASTDRYGFVGEHKQASETTLPTSVLVEREVKWLEMLNSWDKWASKKFKKVKERCRKGIPPSVRGLAWQHLSGSTNLKNQNSGLFEELAQKESDWVRDIEKDLARTFPYHEMFSKKDSQGQRDLYKILKAYAVYDPATGYCQAMAPVAAVLLMHMTAEDAFWVLVMICQKYMPGYYSPKLEAVQLDGAIFGQLLQKLLPNVAKHMKLHRVDPLMYMTEWFMCVLARNLPFASVLRVWDMFFCEGIKVLFRTTIAMIKLGLQPKDLKKYPGIFEVNERLRHLPPGLMQEDSLIPASLALKLSEKDMRREHELQVSK